jgi:YidC/Oxa1 family membrane protein insertase
MSCLPLIAQLPVFIALYYVLRSFAREAVEGGGQVSFMWLIPDVRIELQDIGWGAFVLLAIYAVSQLLSTELSTTPNMSQAQRRLMRFLPLVVVIFAYQFPVPSGLVLYWMTTNLWTCGQQLVIRHRLGLHIMKEATAVAAAPAKSGSRTPSKEELAAAEAAAEEARAAAQAARRGTPRKRRKKPADAAPVSGAVPAGQSPPEDDARPEDARPEDARPESDGRPDGDAVPEPEPAEPEPEPAREPAGAKRGQGARRQPRPRSPKQPSRPAPRRGARRRSRTGRAATSTAPSRSPRRVRPGAPERRG